jgi:hypothetical protein
LVPATAHPPADPGGPPPDPLSAGDVSVFAIRRLYLGDIDLTTGQPGGKAWQELGFDIDGKVTTMQSTDVCNFIPGPNTNPGITQPDGTGGIDNSFGANIVPIFVSVLGDLASANESIEAGLVTDLIVVKGLGSSTTASPLSATLVVAAPLGKKPTWSSGDVWPVDSSSLAAGDANAPLLTFGHGYEVGGEFVAEPPSGAGEISLGIVHGAPLTVPIRHVQVAMTLSADKMTATSGTISGILPTGSFVNLAWRFMGVASPQTVCPSTSSPWSGIAPMIWAAEDIHLDGSNDEQQPCDGISIGLGFEAVRVQMGSPVVVAPPGGACGMMP